MWLNCLQKITLYGIVEITHIFIIVCEVFISSFFQNASEGITNDLNY
jgi:hypothetical protein